MKFISLTFTLILFGFVTSNGQNTEKTTIQNLQQWSSMDKKKMRAQHDQQVLIVVVKVKNESKEAFEKWIKDVLYAALYSSESDMKKAQLNATRWLEPARQNKDSSWTYSWIMDPIIPNTNYDIPAFLNEAYGEKKGKDHWGTYLSFMAESPQSILLTQTDY